MDHLDCYFESIYSEVGTPNAEQRGRRLAKFAINTLSKNIYDDLAVFSLEGCENRRKIRKFLAENCFVGEAGGGCARYSKEEDTAIITERCLFARDDTTKDRVLEKMRDMKTPHSTDDLLEFGIGEFFDGIKSTSRLRGPDGGRKIEKRCGKIFAHEYAHRIFNHSITAELSSLWNKITAQYSDLDVEGAMVLYEATNSSTDCRYKFGKELVKFKKHLFDGVDEGLAYFVSDPHYLEPMVDAIYKGGRYLRKIYSGLRESAFHVSGSGSVIDESVPRVERIYLTSRGGKPLVDARRRVLELTETLIKEQFDAYRAGLFEPVLKIDRDATGIKDFEPF